MDTRVICPCFSQQVKAVYVKNLPKDITQDQLKKLFEHHGKITKIVLPPAKAGQEKNKNVGEHASKSDDNNQNVSSSHGGTHELHVKAGQQSHKNS